MSAGSIRDQGDQKAINQALVISEMDAFSLSVIIPNYNHAKYLPDCLESVFAQTRPADEVTVIDDASTDNSLEVLKTLQDRFPNLKVLANVSNLGVIATINNAIQISKGDYLYFHAADDLTTPKFFEKTLALLARYPDAGLCSTLSWKMAEDGGERTVLPCALNVRTPSFIPAMRARRLLLSQGSWMQGNTCIYRRNALIDIGCFDAELQGFTDGFACEVLAARYGAAFVPEPLAIWRVAHGGYAVRTFNTESVPKIVGHATSLMRSRFKEEFSSEYIRIWERETFFTLSRIVHGAALAEQSKFMQHERTAQKSRNILNRLFYWLLLLTMVFQRLVATCYQVSGYWPAQSGRRTFNRCLRAVTSPFLRR